jgi:hypothetical protein
MRKLRESRIYTSYVRCMSRNKYPVNEILRNGVAFCFTPSDVQLRTNYPIINGIASLLVGAHLSRSEKAANAVFDMEIIVRLALSHPTTPLRSTDGLTASMAGSLYRS